MKNLIPLFGLIFCVQTLTAQQSLTYSSEEIFEKKLEKKLENAASSNKSENLNVIVNVSKNYKKRSPVFDFFEQRLNNVDTIPDFSEKADKIKITGVIYERDGVTPAKDVILFIHQADDNGNFKLKRHNKKRYVRHRGWIKTNADGQYTFYTFIPGKLKYSDGLKQILPIIKEPNTSEYKIESFLFDDEELVTKSYRSKIRKRGVNKVLKPVLKDGLYHINKDIILGKKIASFY